MLLAVRVPVSFSARSGKDLAHCFLGHAEQLKALAQPCFVPFGPDTWQHMCNPELK